MSAQKVRKAVVPAAGLGTRFLPASKAVPKEMLPIVDKPTIQLVVEEAVAAGVEDIVLVQGRNKGAIEEHFDHNVELEQLLRDRGKTELLALAERTANLARLVSIRQKEALGLGHAVLTAKPAVGDEPFAVLLGDDLMDNDDDPAIGQLIRVYEETGCGAVAVVEVPEGQEHLYGIVAGDVEPGGRVRVRDMVEKPAAGTAPSRLAIIGRYVLPAEVWGYLEATEPGHGGEIQLTDALLKLATDGVGLYAVKVAGVRHDAGDKVGYLRANLAYALKRPEMRDAVAEMARQTLREAGYDV